MNQTEKNLAQTKPVNSLKVLIVHLFWMLLGPALLFAFLYVNTTEDTNWLSGIDVAYFVVFALVILSRWLDQRSGQCTLTDGQISTWQDYKRFVYVVVPSALSAWVATNLIGNYLI
jgi:hypothetical protein